MLEVRLSNRKANQGQPSHRVLVHRCVLPILGFLRGPVGADGTRVIAREFCVSLLIPRVYDFSIFSKFFSCVGLTNADNIV